MLLAMIPPPLTANSVCQQALYRRWHRHQAKCQILRSQLGFNHIEPSRPTVCRGCIHYHGKAYGQSRDNRNYLICGFHPYGWTEDTNCPDRTLERTMEGLVEQAPTEN